MQIYWIDENSKYEFNFMFTLQRKVPYRFEFTLKIFSSAFNFLKSTIFWCTQFPTLDSN